MYIIGSRALNFWFPERSIKNETDWDIVGTNEIHPKIIDPSPEGLLTDEICERYSSGKTLDTPIGPATIVLPIALMLFKRSHLHRPLHFQTPIRDYHMLKRVVEVDDDYASLLLKRTKLTKQRYGDKVPSLKKTKDEFFDDYVTKEYEHDDIHRATCYGSEPLFERLKSDDKLVWCEKSKWNQLSYEDKVNCVREEAFVIAIERYILKKKGYPAKFAFNNAVIPA
jgi:hypothetical protein